MVKDTKPSHLDLENALREMLGGRRQVKVKAKPASRVPTITVVLSCRPGNDIGNSVILEHTIATISQFEADLAAFSEARRLGLKLPVILRRIKRT